MIEDDPAQAKREHAMQIERKIASTTQRYEAALALNREGDFRYDELQELVVRSGNREDVG